MGLGLFLVRSQAGRTWVGHTGGMPGHITGVFTHRESGTGAMVLMNSTSAPDPAAFAVALGEHVLTHDPVEDDAWQPGTDAAGRARRAARASGSARARRSCSRWSAGHLEARSPGRSRPTRPPSVFERIERRRLPHRLGPRARRAAAGHPRRQRRAGQAQLGDLPLHPRAARLRRGAPLTRHVVCPQSPLTRQLCRSQAVEPSSCTRLAARRGAAATDVDSAPITGRVTGQALVDLDPDRPGVEDRLVEDLRAAGRVRRARARPPSARAAAGRRAPRRRPAGRRR